LEYTNRIWKQAAVAFPKNVNEVSKTVKAARSHNIEFVVCCGRHSTGGASSIENGLVIDLCNMRKVTVDTEKKTIAVQGGCNWEDVDVEAAKFGLATVGGS
jgi:FAD/FMN-containing dehydrogenase